MDDSTNASKSDKDPAQWLPPNANYHCDYVKNWVEVKTLYGLTYDQVEKTAIENILGGNIELGARKAVVGVQASSGDEMARFAMGITEGNNCGYSSTASLYQKTLIDFSITPAEDHLEQTVDILVVVVVGMVGSQLMGIAGMLIAVPLTGILKVSSQTIYEGVKGYRLE